MKISNIFLIVAIPFWVMMVIESTWTPVTVGSSILLLAVAFIIGLIFFLIRYFEENGFHFIGQKHFIKTHDFKASAKGLRDIWTGKDNTKP
jgi:hypothetical protein